MTFKDPRPEYYLYYKQLLNHLSKHGKGEDCYFDGDLIYPRQFEIHLPGNKLNRCQLRCPHCAGKYFDHALGDWEIKGLSLLDKLQGKIPFHIYGGAYTEPLMNPYFMSFMAMTKKYENHFGIHTNGVALKQLDETQGFLSELNRLSTDDVDYLSVALDAGTAKSWGKVKATKNISQFSEILASLERAVQIRERRGTGHAIRVCYLISKKSDSPEDFARICQWAKDSGIDSLRFSIPFDCYNQTFDKVREYKKSREIPDDGKYREMLSPYLSDSKDEKPYIFYSGPEFTDIDRFTFEHCIYGYYQITYGADGYVYKCSTTATPTGKTCRLGKATDNLEDFKAMILANYSESFNCQKKCFAKKLRCNRMGMEINCSYDNLIKTGSSKIKGLK